MTGFATQNLSLQQQGQTGRKIETGVRRCCRCGKSKGLSLLQSADKICTPHTDGMHLDLPLAAQHQGVLRLQRIQ